MVQNPPEGTQRILPYLNYADPKPVIEFLINAFGFEQGLLLDMPDGSVGHCELQMNGETLMLSSEFPEGGLSSPKSLGGVHVTVLVYVDDVDAHFEHAKAAGAQIVEEPTDQFYGDRTYRALDPEGVGWEFHQHVRDVTPEEMAAALASMDE
ncbi:MAG: VOC family protein [Chloroflexi bacterium]|nr:VOC family protein [Chloroflexota bacterium]